MRESQLRGSADVRHGHHRLCARPAPRRSARDEGRRSPRAVLHPEVDFRGLTPNRFWEAHDRDAVLEIVFGVWFGADDQLEELVLMNSDAFADREQVRFRGRNRDGPMVVEQQAYLTERDGLIGWMRVVCSGQRPLA